MIRFLKTLARKIRELLFLPEQFSEFRQQTRLVLEQQSRQSGELALMLDRQGEDLKLMLGRILANQCRNEAALSADREFRVFSQFGDDGLIEGLIEMVDPESRVFVEFGVENYRESNTRFLLMNRNWSGLVMDSSEANISSIRSEPYFWRFNLKARCAMIDAENINRILAEEGIPGRFGILHIDIDGSDYWVWKAIEGYEPDIVIMEYNSVFGIEKAVTVPYDPAFDRHAAHSSNLYFGASLLALCDLAVEKGYDFVGCNLAGNNAYFVKKGLSDLVIPVDPQSGYVESRFREGRDEKGHLTYLSGSQRRQLISEMEVYNTRTGELEKLGG
jgi:hypothetical protein